MQETNIQGERSDSGEGSVRWDAPLKDYRDVGKLHFPEIKVDFERTQDTLEIAQDVFGDILNVRLKGGWWWTLGMTWTLVKLRGLEQMMYDVYDHPEELHALMQFIHDGHMALLDFLGENKLLSLNNTDSYVGSGGFGWTRELPQDGFDAHTVRTIDMWGFGESQETLQLSPAMLDEFVFRYQLPILSRFGLVCYGCCEPLNERWEIIKAIPGLRRVSVSAWADPADMAEKLGDRYIFSMKPNPAYLAVTSIDEDSIRADLREFVRLTRDCRVEIIMKDNHTIGRNPQNVINWSRIAKEEAGAIYSNK